MIPLPPFKLWRVDSMVCFGIGSVENFRSSAHIPSPCRCSEDSVEKYLAAMRVEIENDAAKQAMIRYDAICDLISCLSSIKGGSQYRAASEEDTTELINELQVTFIDPSYNPVDLAMKIAPSPSHSGGKHTQLIVNTRAISSEFNAEVFSHITRRSIVWSAASRDSFPIKEVIKREPVAIFWHDSDYKDGPGHDQECAVYHKQKAFRMGKVNVWSPYRTSAGYDGFE
ncbi:hypothetical protein QBC34DRAFT_117974 [Podospora aff. communis PSN243]|uniref:Uncharacterized protein n=1 Tax=Podospora aff. communis PSN243 TaxID=3040156 RepID=A0AAV9GIP4_9PEZI|nr:hypothetical protein QBC34DRAFT_117974 [Podospora aff. communis PSN243]